MLTEEVATEKLVVELEKTKKEVLEYGEHRLYLITQYHNTQLNFITELEESIQRAEELLKADIITRRKHAAKQQKILKKLTQFFKKVNTSFEKKEIHDIEGKVFARAYQKTIQGHYDKAKNILSEIKDMVNLYMKFAALEKEAKTLKKELIQKKTAIEASLTEANLVNPIDNNYLEKHEKVLQNLEIIKRIRMEHIQKISGKNIIEYVKLLENKELINTGFPDATPANLINFLNDYPELSQATPEKLLGYQSITDAKLKHEIQEVHRFRNIMNEYASWMKDLTQLELTGFMRVNTQEDAKRLAPLFKGTQAGDVLLRLNELEEYWTPHTINTQTIDTTDLKKELSEIDKELTLLEKI